MHFPGLMNDSSVHVILKKIVFVYSDPLVLKLFYLKAPHSPTQYSNDPQCKGIYFLWYFLYKAACLKKKTNVKN